MTYSRTAPRFLTDKNGNPLLPLPVGGNTAKDGSGNDYYLLVDSDGHLQVDVLSGGTSGTQYTEGDTDTTITGTVAMAEDSDTIKPLQLDSNGYLKVNVVAGGAGGGIAQTQVRDNANTWTDVGYYSGNLNMPVQIEADNSGTKDVNVTNSSLPVTATDLDIRNLIKTQDSVQIWVNTAKDGSGTNYIPLVDADGHLQVDVLSGGGGGTEYTEGDTDATITGKAILWEDASDTLKTVSASTPLPVDVKNSSIPVTDNGGSLTVDGSVSISGNVNIGDISAGTQTNDVKVTLDGEAVKLTSPTDGTYIGDIKFGESLPAGTNNIGDVDIASAIPAGDNTIGRVKITDGTEVASVNASNQLEVAVGNTVSIQDGGNVISIDDAGGSITVDGSVTVSATDLDVRNLAATQDTITAKLATDAIQNGTTALTPKFAKIDVASSGDNTIVSAVTGKKIRVLQYSLVCGAATTVQWKSSGGTTLSGDMQFAANGGISCPFSPVGLFETASGEGLVLNLSAANAVSGHLCYIEI